MRYLLLLLLSLSIQVIPASTTANVGGEDPLEITLHNGSAKSIPLKIEGVMNPNLSPFSKSGVYVTEGTRIFYKDGRKWVLILEIGADDDLRSFRVDRILKDMGLR